MNYLKGESSYWVNQNKLSLVRFEWADGYFSASVSESQVSIVRNYIVCQEEHHQDMTFEEEYRKALKLHKLA